MRQYLTGKAGLTRLLTVVLTTSLLALSSCADEFEKTSKGHNLSMDFTRAGETAVQQIPSMRLFTFNYGTPNDKVFYKEVLNIMRDESNKKVTAQVEVGKWNMALVSTPNGGTIIAPTTASEMAVLPMYKYEPTISSGKSTDAHEMYLDNIETPNITVAGPNTTSAQLNRTVARVDLIIEKTTPNFKFTSAKHKIKLHKVPSTISYTGALLPDAANPTLLSDPLEAPVTLKNGTGGSFEGTEKITFIIPAHRGDAYTSATPTDLVGINMDVELILERSGGTEFEGYETIDVVAQCNKILEVRITVNDGIEFKTAIKDWESVGLNSNVGKGYQNWLYVKQGSNGNGMSWSDALPDINTAITKATALKALSPAKTVHGILVAGGESLVYNESLNIPAGVKIFGGWTGTAGQELASNDVTGPYTSAARNLKDYKVHLATGSGSVQLTGANTVLDGFVVSGTSATSFPGLVTVSNAMASINAVEINQQTINSNHALSISAGTGTNVLISKNNKGVSVTSGGKLVNATVVGNTATSVFSGTLLNSVYWGNSGTATTAGTINYCAFQGTTPAGTNYPLSDTNNLWFTSTNIVPGPHFDLGATPGLTSYEVGTDKPNRSPMLRRGNKSMFDNNLPVTIDDQYKKDINGNIRHHIAIDGTTKVVDIGCYEDGSHPGFQLKWAAEDVYISAKEGYFSQLPLLLPANEDPDINIEVKWTVTVQGGSLIDCSFDGSVVNDVPTGLNTGTGTGVMVGMVQFTPTVEYTTNSERELGSINISTQLGAYLPNTTVTVKQTKGKRTEWKTGYVGSFHRNGERGARYIDAYNSGAWTARIFKGLDWIKIDANDKNYGVDITDAEEGKTPSGNYYKEVEEKWGGVLEGSGNIKFRVGMKSKNTTGEPRYGLIIITRTGGVSYFFIRQGEDDDYLYRAVDTPKPTAGGRTTGIAKFSPYNLTDKNGGTPATGEDLKGKTTFTKYPSQIGYYFKWNQTWGYLYGPTTSTTTSTTATAWSDTREVCPQGYRHPTYLEYCNSIYWNVANSTSVSPSGEYVTLNREWGAYADGWYDQLVTSPLTSSSTTILEVGSGVGRAQKGVLMVSHYTYASIFFPAAGTLGATGQDANTNLNTFSYAMYPTTSSKDVNTHWYDSHIGMSCTRINTFASPVRCVKE